MLAATFGRLVTMDHIDLLGAFLGFLEAHDVAYCVIGGQAVNAYVEPLVSLDLDVAVAVTDIQELARVLGRAFTVSVHPHSLNVSLQGSDLRIQVQTDQRYASFVNGGAVREVLGRPMRVARLADVLQERIWAATDAERRASKRQKDLADIARILDAFPELRENVPPSVLSKLVWGQRLPVRDALRRICCRSGEGVAELAVVRQKLHALPFRGELDNQSPLVHVPSRGP